MGRPELNTAFLRFQGRNLVGRLWAVYQLRSFHPLWAVHRLWAVALLALLAGCANTPLQYPHLPTSPTDATRVELSDTPFYAQEAYHCGPAALATVLQTSGVSDANPETLVDQVYLPGQQGSLQTELLAATRRAERIPYVLEPKLEYLLQELRAGHPVLVLQNLQLPRWPQWHYAVVVGFDLEASEVILRSGITERQVVSLRRFERTWQLGDYWAMVVPEPGQIPKTATATKYLQAVVALEQQGRWPVAAQGYQTALEHWPDNPASHIGLGNIAYQTEDYQEAERQFRAAIQLAPDTAAAHYNLAWAVLRQGRLEEAKIAARQAEQLGPEKSHFSQAVAAIEADAAGIAP